jgi:hypothetical protein
LLGPFKFVDRQKNSIDPPSNEFRLQPADLALYFLTQTGQSGGKNAIFAVLRKLEPDAGGGEDIADPRALLVGDRQTLGEVGPARLDRGFLLLAFLRPTGSGVGARPARLPRAPVCSDPNAPTAALNRCATGGSMDRFLRLA